MTTTLQQALIKAGLANNKKLPEKPAEKKGVLKKGPPRGSFSEVQNPVGFVEKKHKHHLRTECDACQKSGPDVEYYEHKNRILDAKWLCIKCADTYNIHDDCRETIQSQFAMTGRFIRGWGPTKVFK
jgi:hypothetical protein